MSGSVGDVLSRQKGFGPGFDFARIFLSFSVLLWHSEYITAGTYARWQQFSIYEYSVVPMFFALSGFLIAGSAQRLSLGNFLVNRGLRIVPALFVEVTLSALVLGPLVTTLPLNAYFSSPGFAAYFLNIIGYIHFKLPGVFLDNPDANVVNGSLWTVPFEVLCYLVMAGLIVSGALRRQSLLVMATVGICGLGLLLSLAAGAFSQTHLLLALNQNGRGGPLLPCFVFGVLFHVLRYRIPYDWRIFAACLAGMVVIGLLLTPERWQLGLSLLASPILTYIVVFVGLTQIPRVPYFWRGDYSYGIYLYGFPIQQTLIHYVPTMKSVPVFFLISAICTTVLASLSWSYIEKPILRLRRNFSFVARKQHNAEAIANSPAGGQPAGEPVQLGEKAR